MHKGIAITGMGIISSIGNTTSENLMALQKSSAGISRIENIETQHQDQIRVGEIKKTNELLINELQLPQDNTYSRTSLLSEIAAREALKQAGIDDVKEFRTGFISSTSVGGMDLTEKFYTVQFQEDTFHRYIASHSAGNTTSIVAKRLGITDFVTTISTACSSAANAIMLGARMIKSGALDRVVVGGADCLSKFTINGFNALMILSKEHCTPFDKDRTGLNLGEAGAYLVLESDKVVQQKNKKVLAYVSGYANANDAYHQTASSENGEGATLAMQDALKVAGLNPSEIDYVNAHGTATENNDKSESKALLRVFGEAVPQFSSTKAFTGHTLAAAAAVEAVFSVLALQEQHVFPNLNFKDPIPDTNLIPVTHYKETSIKHVLSNSFGFGGNCSTLIFSKS